MASSSRNSDEEVFAESPGVQQARRALEDAEMLRVFLRDLLGKTLGGRVEKLAEEKAKVEADRDAETDAGAKRVLELKAGLVERAIQARIGNMIEGLRESLLDGIREAKNNLETAKNVALNAAAIARGKPPPLGKPRVRPKADRPSACEPNDVRVQVDRTRSQIEQFESFLTMGRPGPADGQAVQVDSDGALSGLSGLANVALKYTARYKNWDAAFGGIPDHKNATQPAFDEAIGLAKNAKDFKEGTTPIYVVDGGNIFYKGQDHWDHGWNMEQRFLESDKQHGPVIVVVTHNVLFEQLLTVGDDVPTDEVLKHMEHFLCQLHGDKFKTVIVELHPEKCFDNQDRADGMYPCLYNDKALKWKDDAPDNPEFPRHTQKKYESECRVWRKEEDQTDPKWPLAHVYCEFDDAVIDALIIKIRGTDGGVAHRVSNDHPMDRFTTTVPNRLTVWNEMHHLGDRMCVRLYEIVYKDSDSDNVE